MNGRSDRIRNYSFALGFFGPILLWRQANQGPLLGIFITGPLGFVMGLVVAVANVKPQFKPLRTVVDGCQKRFPLTHKHVRRETSRTLSEKEEVYRSITGMLKSILAAILLLAFIPVIGYLAVGPVCLIMHFANVPGHSVWNFGAGQQRPFIRGLGLLLGWFAQSAVSISFAFALVQLVQFFFRHFELPVLFRWPYWAAIFLLSLSPGFKTLIVTEGLSSDVLAAARSK